MLQMRRVQPPAWLPSKSRIKLYRTSSVQCELPLHDYLRNIASISVSVDIGVSTSQRNWLEGVSGHISCRCKATFKSLESSQCKALKKTFFITQIIVSQESQSTQPYFSEISASILLAIKLLAGFLRQSNGFLEVGYSILRLKEKVQYHYFREKY